MALYEAAETLPEKYRMPLMLFAIGEYDINEIASDLHLNGASARMRWGLFGIYAGTRGTVFDSPGPVVRMESQLQGIFQ